MKVYIGADHRGFELKGKLIPWIKSMGHEIYDLGNLKYDKDDDFPDFSLVVAENVAENPGSRGIVICGSGCGVNVAANKVVGVRCSTGVNAHEVEHARAHDDLNILALSADYIPEEINKEMIEVFLKTPFSNEERHIRRIKKIKEYENKGCGGCCGGCK